MELDQATNSRQLQEVLSSGPAPESNQKDQRTRQEQLESDTDTPLWQIFPGTRSGSGTVPGDCRVEQEFKLENCGDKVNAVAVYKPWNRLGSLHCAVWM